MEVRLLGAVELEVGGHATPISAAKQRGMLAMLALRANETVTADRLMEGLWGEEPPPSAPKLVQRHVSELRRLMVGDGDGAIVTRGRGYELRIEIDHVDVQRFERLVREGAPRQGLALWRGSALADVSDEPFAAPEIRRLEELRLGAIEAALDEELLAGRHRDVVGELTRLVADHPLSERLHGQLMLALYRCGRQAEALEAYRVARTALVGAMGVEPGPELRALHAAILHQSPELAPPNAGPRHRLVGRDRELAALRAAWRDARAGEDVLVVISGPPGSGRTRLAAELAAEAGERGLRIVDDVPAETMTVARGPGLTVAITEDAHLAAGLPDARHVPLGPLDDEAVATVARQYTDGTPVPLLAERSGGLPKRVHALAAAWAQSEAGRRVAPTAGRAAAQRERLREVEAELAERVEGLQAARRLVEQTEQDRHVVVCPYKGLATFDVEDSPFFFGRERLVSELVARLVGAPLLGIVGPSGSGKSSVLRAGLLAELARGVLPGSDGWSHALLRPGAHPLRELDRASECRLIAVDQFEELFTQCDDEAERSAFVDRLVELAAGPAIVVVAIRADFYGRCAAYPSLARLLGANHVLVGPMTRDELRRAIELPAQRAGLDVEPALVEALLDDVAGEPGAPPMLSSALLELWEHRDGRRLFLGAYTAAGGVRGAVARLAESAYAALDAAGQARARRIFLRLAGDDAGGGAVRTRVPLAELDEASGPVVAALADRRLVTISGDTVEVAHEALLREWPRLRAWLEEDTDGRRLHRRLAAAAREWEQAGRDPSELLRGARLAATLDWARSHDGDVSEGERAFIDASRRESETEATRARRLNRRLTGLLAGVLALLALAAGAGALFLKQRGEARDRARIADARRLAAQAPLEDDLDRSLLLARQAVAVDDSPETRGALLTVLMNSAAALRVSRIGQGLNTLNVRPDGRALVLGDWNGHVRFLDPSTRRQLRPALNRSPDPMRQLVFNHSGSRLVVGRFGALELLDGRTFRSLGEYRPPEGDPEFTDVAFSPDDRQFIAVHEQDARMLTLRFDGRTGRPLGAPAALPMHGYPADVAAFTPDGRRLVVAKSGRGGAVLELDARTLRLLHRYPAPVSAGALAPDGRTFAAGSPDGSVRLIDLATGRIRLALGSHDGAVIAASFTADGRRLLTTGEDSTVVVWDVGRAALEDRFTDQSGRLMALAISPGDATAYTASGDGSLISWDLTGARGFGQDFRAGARFDGIPVAAISPDGRLLATSGRDGAVSLVDTRTLRRRTLPVLGDAPPYGPLQPAFISNDALVVTGRNGLVERVDVRTGRRTARLRGHQVDVSAPVVSRDGRVLVAGAGDGLLAWDLRTLRPIGRSTTLWTPASYAIDPRASLLAATVGGSGTVDLLAGAARRRLARLPVDGTDIIASAFSPDGRLLAAGSDSGRVRIFSVARRAATAPAFDALPGAVESVAFSPDGRTLVTAGQNGQIRLWDVRTRRPIGAPLPAPKGANVAIAFTPDGRAVLAVFSDGSGARWDVEPASWEQRACAIAGRRLTRFEWQQLLPGRPYAPAC